MITLFKHLISINYHGLYISRTFDEKFLNTMQSKNTSIISLSDQDQEGLTTTSNIKDLFSFIKEFLTTKKQEQKVLLFDRIDYLMMFYSFDTIIRFLYNINDLVRKNNAIFLLYFNIDIANESHWKLLEMEFSQIPSEQIQDIFLSKIEYDILQYLFDMQKQNTRVNYKNIGSRFHLSKVTVKKYIDSLLDRELIYNEKHGRTKFLYLTLKGKTLIDHR
jgi:DNA-binding MarR family transcriptional regulator